MKKFSFYPLTMYFLIPASLAFAQTTSPSVSANELDTAKRLLNFMLELMVKYSFQVLGGIIVLVCGWMLANFVSQLVRNALAKHQIDITVTKFISSTIKLGVMGFAVLIALSKFGIEIAPFIAGLSVVGFGTSFALQGPLSNYASGASLIFTKPFKVGDIIEVAGVLGEVEDISLPRTQIVTVDGVKIVIPNKHIIGEIIHNYSDLKKLDIKVAVSYESNVQKAMDVIRGITKREQRLTCRTEPKIGILEFADSGVILFVRLWCKQAQYWDVIFDMHKAILDEFARNNIVIPYPHRDVRILNKEVSQG